MKMITIFKVYENLIYNKTPLFYRDKNPTGDIVVIKDNKVLLIRRSKTSSSEPGKLALPGGFVNSSSLRGELFVYDIETPRDAAIRELKEETNLDLKSLKKMLKKIGTFQGNGRDPRDTYESYTQSHSYIIEIDDTIDISNLRGMDDAEDVTWIDIGEIEKMNLAFDHLHIIKNGLSILKKK
jgi:ADP-ribose pyrophosphatase YjhB (NUDIX family)